MDILSISGLNNNISSQIDILKQSDIEATSFQEELQNAINDNDDKSLKEACIAFEGYFLKMMLSNMRNTIISDEDGFFAKSDGEKIFQDLLDEEICDSIANGSNNVGLADMLYKQLSKSTSNSISFEA